MATANQIKSLIRAHFDQGNERFRTCTLQISAYGARLGHLNLDNEAKNLNDIVKSCLFKKYTIPYNRPAKDLRGILSVVYLQKWFTVIIPINFFRNKIGYIILKHQYKEIRRQLNFDFGQQ